MSVFKWMEGMIVILIVNSHWIGWFKTISGDTSLVQLKAVYCQSDCEHEKDATTRLKTRITWRRTVTDKICNHQEKVNSTITGWKKLRRSCIWKETRYFCLTSVFLFSLRFITFPYTDSKRLMFRLNKVQSDPCCQVIDNTSFTAPCWASYSTFGDHVPQIRNRAGNKRKSKREKLWRDKFSSDNTIVDYYCVQNQWSWWFEQMNWIGSLPLTMTF